MGHIIEWNCKTCVDRETGLDSCEEFAIGGTDATCVQCGERKPRAEMYALREGWRDLIPTWRKLAARATKKSEG